MYLASQSYFETEGRICWKQLKGRGVVQKVLLWVT